MPSISSITIQNFKGIEKISIDLDNRINCPVITLIGLNESGKTTILEGLSHFVTGDSAVSSIFQGVHSKSAATAFIPVHRKAAFTGEISIKAEIQLDEADYKKAQAIADKSKIQINKEVFFTPLTAIRKYKYEDSVYKELKNEWSLELKVSTTRTTSEKTYKRPNDQKQDLWLKIVNQIESELPKIAYFPTFLVDMPSRIYLKEHKEETAVNRYYRYVFQDILDSLNEDLSLEKHVCKRIEDFKTANATATWFSEFVSGQTKSTIDSVFQKISNAVTKEVLGSWQKVFQRTISAKNIFIEWNIDAQKSDLPYASFVVSDGESRYGISERSLGFRWFFSFLLFTAFKQAKKRPTIFLFDEPAANLHAKAQAELLKSFSRIVSDGNRIVYSTHSHHMINPHWLSGAYIVENTALDYDSDDAFGLNAKPTSIHTTKYRDFVSQYPSRSSYFQPVIEMLEYVTPDIIGNSPFVILEGITDYFALVLASRAAKKKLSFSLMPGAGAGASGPLISLLIGRGERFILLLDDDKPGREAAKRYKNEWFLENSSVVTLGELVPALENHQLESLLSDETMGLIATELGISSKPTKKQVGWYLAEMVATGDSKVKYFSKETLKILTTILNKLEDQLGVKK